MNLFESTIYGFITGLTEFLPISSKAHQDIMQHLFGTTPEDPVRNLLIHIALLLSLYTSCKSLIDHLKRQRSAQSKSNNSRNYRSQSLSDYRLIKGATVPMVLCIFLITYMIRLDSNLLLVSLFLLINSIILFVPDRMMQGNKDARSMSTLDGVIIGILASLFSFSGISRVGCIYAVSTARGAGHKSVLTWSLLLSIPALIAVILIDFIDIFSGTAFPFWSNLGGYFISAVAAYIGGYIGIGTLRLVLNKTNFTSFAFYSLGAALLSFILYLTVA